MLKADVVLWKEKINKEKENKYNKKKAFAILSCRNERGLKKTRGDFSDILFRRTMRVTVSLKTIF